MKNTLEGHRFFPVIAWTLVLGFVFFTYTLTVELTQATGGINQNTQATVSTLLDGA